MSAIANYLRERIKAEAAKEDDEREGPCSHCDGSLLVVAPSGAVIDCRRCKEKARRDKAIRLDRMMAAECDVDFELWQQMI